jgi:hypothetical protein
MERNKTKPVTEPITKLKIEKRKYAGQNLLKENKRPNTPTSIANKIKKKFFLFNSNLKNLTKKRSLVILNPSRL